MRSARFTRVETVFAALTTMAASVLAGVPGSEITYQGMLKDDGASVDGPVNLEFRLFDDELAGSQIGSTVMTTETVTDGLFAAELDFGVTPYTGTDALWLEVTVEGQVLARQKITPAPFSMATRGIDVDASGGVSIGTAPTANRLTVGGASPIPEPQPGALNGSTSISAMALDAVIEVVGAQAGGLSAGFGLKELAMDGSHLSTWSLVRETGVNGALVIQNGTDPSPFGNTEQMRITAGGNVGIGTATPEGQLDVVAPGFTSVQTRSSGASGVAYYLENSGRKYGLKLRADSLLAITDDTAGNVDRFIMDTAGNVGIGTESPSFLLHVNGTAGKPGGGSWSTASDARLKKNIVHLDGALDTLLRLQGVTFEYEDPEAINELEGTRMGFIAQDVERVIPDWVSDAQDGYKRLTIRGFEALAVEALRELDDSHSSNRAALDRLRAQLAERDAEITGLGARLSRLERLLGTQGK